LPEIYLKSPEAHASGLFLFALLKSILCG